MNYQEFIESKKMLAQATGFHVDPSRLNSNLMPWQRAVTIWALGKGRAALFEPQAL